MIADQVIQIIEHLAEQFGIAVDKVYPMLVAQSKVFCSTYRVSIWVALASAVLLVVGIIAYVVADKNYSDCACALSVGLIVISAITLVVAVIISLCYLNSYFTALYNPDLWAIEYVTTLIK